MAAPTPRRAAATNAKIGGAVRVRFCVTGKP
jgi:hypothetical protein